MYIVMIEIIRNILSFFIWFFRQALNPLILFPLALLVVTGAFYLVRKLR